MADSNPTLDALNASAPTGQEYVLGGNGYVLVDKATGEPIDKGAYTASNGVLANAIYNNPVTSDSSSIVNKENQLGNDINSAYLESLNKSDRFLLDRQNYDISAANANYERELAALGITQANESGNFNSKLQKLGAYLGNSSYEIGAIANLNIQHKREMELLGSKRDALIQAAKDAYTTGHTDIAEKINNEQRALRKEIEDKNQRYLDNSLKILETNRAERESLAKRNKEKISANAPAVADYINSLPDEASKEKYITEHATALGITADELKSGIADYTQKQNDKIDSKILDISEKIPGLVTNLDIKNHDIATVLNKYSKSDYYKNLTSKSKAESDKAIADAIVAQNKSNPSSETEALTFCAGQLKNSGTGTLPAACSSKIDSYGVIKKIADNISLKKGTIVNDDGFRIDIGLGGLATNLSATYSILERLPRVKEILNELKTNPAAAFVKGVAGGLGSKSDLQVEFESLIRQLNSDYAQAKSGVAVSEQEAKRLAEQLSKTSNYKDYNLTQLQTFEDGLKTAVRSVLALKGLNLYGTDLRTSREIAADNKKIVDDFTKAAKAQGKSDQEIKDLLKQNGFQ